VTPDESGRRDRSSPSILLFVGAGRSGTTILEMLIGREFAATGIGEVRWLWERGLDDNQLCSCGLPTRSCPLWSHVFAEVRAGFADELDFRAAVDDFNAVMGQRIIPLLPVKSRETQRRLAQARRLVGSVYRAVDMAYDGTIIVDSSKDPTFAYVVETTPGINAAYVSMIRDSRAVVYSWKRKKLRPEVHWTTDEMPRPSTFTVSLDWVYRILAVGWLMTGRREQYLSLRYEVFARGPDDTMRKLARLLTGAGMRVRPSDPEADNYHSVSGNPVRFSATAMDIQPDEEWRSKLARGDRYLTSVLTGPMLALHRLAVRRGLHRLSSAGS
jgi:hypothetical protein